MKKILLALLATASLHADPPRAVPVEATYRFRVNVGDSIKFTVTGGDKTLLECSVALPAPNNATITAKANGEPLVTDLLSMRTWSQMSRTSGAVRYTWRFPTVKNLWDDRDRAEIGAAYAKLVPFAEKTLTARLVLTADSRQVWIDDRFVGETRVATTGPVEFKATPAKKAELESAEFGEPAAAGVLRLDDYRDIDLGQTFYRYRLTHGSGPDASYVNGKSAWPGTFEVDPAVLSFRVPYRVYQNVWLTVWLDDESGAVPRGTLRFFRQDAGYPASTDFEISEAAIKQGLVTKLKEKTADGKQLYRVRVPVETDKFYGLRDTVGSFLEFELSKPVSLIRGYPDPIYYGYHPAGPPSSIHVTGITLEEAPFDYEVKPAKVAHVFERPEKPSYTVTISSALAAKVTLETRSFDGEETTTTTGVAKNGAVKLTLDLKKNGWHELRCRVEAGNVTRTNTLSLVVLPPNTRTYGNAVNERRFGVWTLWGHYLPMRAGAYEKNETYLPMFRALGLRRFGSHGAFYSDDVLKRYDFLPKAPHTIVAVFHRLNENDPEAMAKMVEAEVAQVAAQATNFTDTAYFYGGEWALSKEIQYAPWPRYTGDGDRALTEDEQKRAARHVKIFTAIGTALREKYPQTTLYLQWGAPLGTLAYLKHGFDKKLVDGFGMDAPMFELVPEASNVAGAINSLWGLRAEAAQLGWPRLPMAWCEGPFFPTNPGALTESKQAEYQIRYMLAGLAYGIDNFEAGIVDFDAGNYYGAEHYGAGIFHRTPLENPKPAVAAVATATAMLCGADPVGGVDTGVLTTYCMAFQRAKTKEMLYALWRVNGTVRATLRVAGSEAVVTDAMGNATKLPVKDGQVTLTLSSSPVWLTGVTNIEGFTFDAPVYTEAPASIVRPLAAMNAATWTYDGSEDASYAHNHFAVRRVTDPNLKAEFGTDARGDAVAITLPVGPGDRPLVNRYGSLRAKKPIPIPGKASALGIWINGNSSWGRVVYQLRDAKGELWTSAGTKNDWNCDDTHGWSYVNFEGWRYVRFPLPGNHPYDAARETETTWWGSSGGDGIVDWPLTVERIFVEARNEVPYLSEMKLVPERSYKLAGLVAEYAAAADLKLPREWRMARPEWTGPTGNPIARLTTAGVGDPPVIQGFHEPGHWNDGRRMNIRFEPVEGRKYNLYLSRYADGRGADLLKTDVKDKQLITGMRPELKMYFFLTSVGADKKESKPSAAFELVTHDNFAEK